MQHVLTQHGVAFKLVADADATRLLRVVHSYVEGFFLVGHYTPDAGGWRHEQNRLLTPAAVLAVFGGDSWSAHVPNVPHGLPAHAEPSGRHRSLPEEAATLIRCQPARQPPRG